MAHGFLPVAEHGFLLHKGEFRDALCLRYGWNLNNTPHSCNCGTSSSVDYAMIYHMGGIPTIRHNEIRDITATLLTNICHNIATEQLLQLLSNESFAHRSANRQPNACLNIRTRGFWNRGQDAFFHVRVFHSNVSSSCSMTPLQRTTNMRHKKEGVWPTCLRSGAWCFHTLHFHSNGWNRL